MSSLLDIESESRPQLYAMTSNSSIVRHTRPRPRVESPWLSAEALREIFLYCASDSVGDLDPNVAPLLLRHVCRRWRAIADTTRNLWSKLYIAPPHFDLPSTQIVKEWLERSVSTQLLDITIHSPPCANPVLVVAFLAEIVTTSHRWRTLNLDIPAAFLPMILSNDAAPLSALEQLHLVMNEQPLFTIDPSAVRLRDLTLVFHSSLMVPDTGSLNLAWGQITHLDMRTVAGNIDSAWHILSHCPQLIDFTITTTNNIPFPIFPSHHSHRLRSILRRLTLFVDVHPVNINYFLDKLDLPYIQGIEIIFTDTAKAPWLWPCRSLLDLRQRCFPPLSSVAIVGKRVREVDLMEFVRRMKYLEQIMFSCDAHDFVTPKVKALLPANDDIVELRRAAYRCELERAAQLQKMTNSQNTVFRFGHTY